MRYIIFSLLFFLPFISFAQHKRPVIRSIKVKKNENERFAVIGQWDMQNMIYYYTPCHYREGVEVNTPRHFKIKTDTTKLDKFGYGISDGAHFFRFGEFRKKQEFIFFLWNTSYNIDSNIYVDDCYPNDIVRIPNYKFFYDSVYSIFEYRWGSDFFSRLENIIYHYDKKNEPYLERLIEEGKPIPKKIEEELLSKKREHWIVQRAGVRFYLYNIKKKNLGKYLEMIMSFEEIPYVDYSQIQKPILQKQYIHTLKTPKNLTEAFNIFNSTLSEEDINRIKSLPEDSVLFDDIFVDYKADFAKAWGLFEKKNTKIKKLFKEHKVCDSKCIYNYLLILYNRDLNYHPMMYEKYQADDYLIRSVIKDYLDTINGFYVPKNIEDCFLTLDHYLPDEDKEHLKSLQHRDSTIHYHFSLGMYLRNNWGLWQGSRLEKYFRDRGVKHPDSMSGLIIEYYYDWLNNRNEDWMEFDKNIKR
ncbi:MAG: hypothetical protein PHO12_09545 [Bacteroidales bacterium]|nr:hypothetical protein [Bacteroidales bacterium]